MSWQHWNVGPFPNKSLFTDLFLLDGRRIGVEGGSSSDIAGCSKMFLASSEQQLMVSDREVGKFLQLLDSIVPSISRVK